MLRFTITTLTIARISSVKAFTTSAIILITITITTTVATTAAATVGARIA